MCVDGSWILCSAGGSEFLSGREQRFDCFVSKDYQRGHRSQTGRDRLVAGCPAYPADDLFATEFLQIVSRAAGTVLRLGLFAECADPRRQFGGREAVG